MPPFSHEKFSERLLAKIEKLRTDTKTLAAEKDAITNALDQVSFILKAIETSDIRIPKSINDRLKQTVKDNIEEFINHEEIIAEIKKELEKIINHLTEIASHLEAIRLANKDVIEKINAGDLHDMNLQRFVSVFGPALKKSKGFKKAHDEERIREIIKDIDRVLENFVRLDKEEKKEYQILLDLQKITQQYNQAFKKAFEASVRAKGTLQNFEPLRDALQDITHFVLGFHEDIKKDKAFMRELKHLK